MNRVGVHEHEDVFCPGPFQKIPRWRSESPLVIQHSRDLTRSRCPPSPRLEKTEVCWNKNRRVEFFLRPSRSSSQYSWVVEAAPTRDKAAADLLHIEQR